METDIYTVVLVNEVTQKLKVVLTTLSEEEARAKYQSYIDDGVTTDTIELYSNYAKLNRVCHWINEAINEV